jgi:hypothetical protein
MTKAGQPDPFAPPALPGFIATTSRSAPVPRIGTLLLTGLPLGVLPWHRDDRFPRSTKEPRPSSRHLYAGRHPSSKQVASWTVLGDPRKSPILTSLDHAFDISSVVHLRSSSRPSPDTSCVPFPHPLTTTPFERSSVRRFGACSCQPAPKGPPSSLLQLRSPVCSSFRVRSRGTPLVHSSDPVLYLPTPLRVQPTRRLSGIPSAVIAFRILQPTLASSLCPCRVRLRIIRPMSAL